MLIIYEKLSVIKKAFNNCIKSIKNMNQKGGGINEIDVLNNNIKKLNKKILKMEYNMNILNTDVHLI
jgi:hypothetical protein